MQTRKSISRFLTFTNPTRIKLTYTGKGKGEGEEVPLQAWSGPEGSRKLRFPDFMTKAKDVVRLSA